MHKEEINFEIKPIFCPNEEICKNFADIDILCGTLIERNMFYLCRNLDKQYLDMWKKEKHVFAFAAYYSGQMVGFTTGFARGKNMFTNALYVTPEYHGYGIGTNLLGKSEQAAGLIASNMELISSDNAISFYREHGYENTIVFGRVTKTKELPKITANVVPVFEWWDKLSLKLNVRMYTDLLKQNKHQPIFVYVNDVQRIDGVAMRLPDGKDFIKCKNYKIKNAVAELLLNELNNVR